MGGFEMNKLKFVTYATLYLIKRHLISLSRSILGSFHLMQCSFTNNSWFVLHLNLVYYSQKYKGYKQGNERINIDMFFENLIQYVKNQSRQYFDRHNQYIYKFMHGKRYVIYINCDMFIKTYTTKWVDPEEVNVSILNGFVFLNKQHFPSV